MLKAKITQTKTPSETFNQELKGLVGGKNNNCGANALLHHVLAYLKDPVCQPALTTPPYLCLLNFFKASLRAQHTQPLKEWEKFKTSLKTTFDPILEFLCDSPNPDNDPRFSERMQLLISLQETLNKLSLKSWQNLNVSERTKFKDKIVEFLQGFMNEGEDGTLAEKFDFDHMMSLADSTYKALPLTPSHIKNPSKKQIKKDWAYIQNLAITLSPYELEKIFGDAMRRFIGQQMKLTQDPDVKRFVSERYNSVFYTSFELQLKKRLPQLFEHLVSQSKKPAKGFIKDLINSPRLESPSDEKQSIAQYLYKDFFDSYFKEFIQFLEEQSIDLSKLGDDLTKEEKSAFEIENEELDESLQTALLKYNETLDQEDEEEASQSDDDNSKNAEMLEKVSQFYERKQKASVHLQLARQKIDDKLDILIEFFVDPPLKGKITNSHKNRAHQFLTVKKNISTQSTPFDHSKGIHTLSPISAKSIKNTKRFWEKKGANYFFNYVANPTNQYQIMVEELVWGARALGFKFSPFYTEHYTPYPMASNYNPSKSAPTIPEPYLTFKVCNYSQNHWEFQCINPSLAYRHNEQYQKACSQDFETTDEQVPSSKLKTMTHRALDNLVWAQSELESLQENTQDAPLDEEAQKSLDVLKKQIRGHLQAKAIDNLSVNLKQNRFLTSYQKFCEMDALRFEAQSFVTQHSLNPIDEQAENEQFMFLQDDPSKELWNSLFWLNPPIENHHPSPLSAELQNKASQYPERCRYLYQSCMTKINYMQLLKGGDLKDLNEAKKSLSTFLNAHREDLLEHFDKLYESSIKHLERQIKNNKKSTP